MKLPVFQLINFIIILTVFIFLIKYLWDLLFDKSYQPAAWMQAKKAGRISHRLIKMERNYPDKVRFFNWWFQTERIKKENIPGSFAEVGVYKGDSARILHAMDPERKFHLFDTFSGFTGIDLEREKGEAATYTTSNFADTSVKKVMERISGNPNVFIHPGYFPDTAMVVENESFALVNLDADLYTPTRTGLEFFYPRLSPGGVLIVHDYNEKWEGIVKAVDEFSVKIKESLIRIPDMEGTVMIIRSKTQV